MYNWFNYSIFWTGVKKESLDSQYYFYANDGVRRTIWEIMENLYILVGNKLMNNTSDKLYILNNNCGQR